MLTGRTRNKGVKGQLKDKSKDLVWECVLTAFVFGSFKGGNWDRIRQISSLLQTGRFQIPFEHAQLCETHLAHASMTHKNIKKALKVEKDWFERLELSLARNTAIVIAA